LGPEDSSNDFTINENKIKKESMDDLIKNKDF
jgi:hypothetical protein